MIFNDICSNPFGGVIDPSVRSINPPNGFEQMSLKIIGSCFGRTGTMSTKIELEQLGLGPCYHMAEVMGSPDQHGYWQAYAQGLSLIHI